MASDKPTIIGRKRMLLFDDSDLNRTANKRLCCNFDFDFDAPIPSLETMVNGFTIRLKIYRIFHSCSKTHGISIRISHDDLSSDVCFDIPCFCKVNGTEQQLVRSLVDSKTQGSELMEYGVDLSSLLQCGCTAYFLILFNRCDLFSTFQLKRPDILQTCVSSDVSQTCVSSDVYNDCFMIVYVLNMLEASRFILPSVTTFSPIKFPSSAVLDTNITLTQAKMLLLARAHHPLVKEVGVRAVLIRLQNMIDSILTYENPISISSKNMEQIMDLSSIFFPGAANTPMFVIIKWLQMVIHCIIHHQSFPWISAQHVHLWMCFEVTHSFITSSPGLMSILHSSPLAKVIYTMPNTPISQTVIERLLNKQDKDGDQTTNTHPLCEPRLFNIICQYVSPTKSTNVCDPFDPNISAIISFEQWRLIQLLSSSLLPMCDDDEFLSFFRQTSCIILANLTPSYAIINKWMTL